MKVVMAGASGTGKTTLAKWVGERFGIPFTENSAGLIMGKRYKETLGNAYGYHGDWGQTRVINESHSIPSFGFSFQNFILESRHELIHKAEHGVFDRSPIDPMAFFYNQCVHNQTEKDSSEFLDKCCRYLFDCGITHIIYVPLLTNMVENNGSRNSNYYFQKKVDNLFQLAMQDVIDYQMNHRKELMGVKLPYILRVSDWDWNLRIDQVDKFITNNTL